MVQTEALSRLLDVVGETLEIEPPSASANFLDLGGDSLSAIIVAETLRDDGISIAVDDLYSALSLDRVAFLLGDLT